MGTRYNRLVSVPATKFLAKIRKLSFFFQRKFSIFKAQKIYIFFARASFRNEISFLSRKTPKNWTVCSAFHIFRLAVKLFLATSSHYLFRTFYSERMIILYVCRFSEIFPILYIEMSHRMGKHTICIGDKQRRRPASQLLRS